VKTCYRPQRHISALFDGLAAEDWLDKRFVGVCLCHEIIHLPGLSEDGNTLEWLAQQIGL
jgi:hypothetical protein